MRKKGQKKTIFILLFVYDINYRMEADRVLANWHEYPYQLLIFFVLFVVNKNYGNLNSFNSLEIAYN